MQTLYVRAVLALTALAVAAAFVADLGADRIIWGD